MARSAVVLLSGGLDSATCLALAAEQGFTCIALSFDYGQRHRAELDAARDLAAAAQEHLVVQFDLRAIGGSSLTSDSPVPDAGEAGDSAIPSTYVPARNTIFLSFALAVAEARAAEAIFIGVNALDYSGYPDCRPEYIAAFQAMAALATRDGVEGRPTRIETPLIGLTKAQIAQAAHRLGVDIARTVSCYRATADGRACGRCDACALRQKGFAEAGLADPTRYA